MAASGKLFTGEQFDANLNQIYLRARYYDPSIGRFTSQDTWMGSNSDPITLHKYLYANVDPVNNIDPTGKFSLGSLMSAINIASNLVTIAQAGYSVFQIASGEEELSAKKVGSAILLNMLGAGAGKVIGFFGKKVSKLYKDAGCTGSRNSFIAGTLINTENGLKPIEGIAIGDLVWAFNVETEEKTLQPVVHLIEGEGEKALVDIELSTGEVISSTDNHPFWVGKTSEWVLAKDLNLQSQLLGINSNILNVTNLDQYKKNIKVFNLTVDGDHTYYVGESGILNHNCPFDNLNYSWRSVPTFGHTFNTHGAGARNTRRLTGRARGTNTDQGQWQDNGKAAEFLKNYSLIADGPVTVPIPRGLGKVIRPDGSTVDVTYAVIVPKGDGTFRTGYPVIGRVGR